MRNKWRFRHVFEGKNAAIWGPRLGDDPLTEEPHKAFTSTSWIEELAEVVRELDTRSVGVGDSTERKLDFASIRRDRAAHLPRVPTLNPDRTRSIERRASLAPGEILSYVLWGIPVIVTDATADWGCLNWTFDHVKSTYPHFLNGQYVLGAGDVSLERCKCQPQ